jgi:inorganic pyrophosphatase
MCVILYATVEKDWSSFWTTGAFFCGAVTSIVAGYIGMKVAVYSNGIVALEAKESLARGFLVAFRAGSVMGFVLTSLGLLVLLLLLFVYNTTYGNITFVKDSVDNELAFSNFK